MQNRTDACKDARRSCCGAASGHPEWHANRARRLPPDQHAAGSPVQSTSGRSCCASSSRLRHVCTFLPAGLRRSKGGGGNMWRRGRSTPDLEPAIVHAAARSWLYCTPLVLHMQPGRQLGRHVHAQPQSGAHARTSRQSPGPPPAGYGPGCGAAPAAPRRPAATSPCRWLRQRSTAGRPGGGGRGPPAAACGRRGSGRRVGGAAAGAAAARPPHRLLPPRRHRRQPAARPGRHPNWPQQPPRAAAPPRWLPPQRRPPGAGERCVPRQSRTRTRRGRRHRQGPSHRRLGQRLGSVPGLQTSAGRRRRPGAAPHPPAHPAAAARTLC